MGRRASPPAVAVHLPVVAAETLADLVAGAPPAGRADARPSTLEAGPVTHRVAPPRGRRVGSHDGGRAGRRRRGPGHGEASAVAADAAGRRRRVDRGRARWGVFFAIVAAVVVLDQLTKAWLVANVAPGEVVQVIGDYLRLVHSQNSGALFGLFRDQAILFGLVSLGVVGLIVAYHGRSGRQPATCRSRSGCCSAARIGNLIDRLRLGYVVDFVDIGIGDVRF